MPSRSYSIQVALLAGLPKEILDRAKGILAHLEKPNGVTKPVTVPRSKRSEKAMPTGTKPQLDLL